LYSAVYVRRRGLAATCTSSPPTATCASIGSSRLALLSNFRGRDCLTHPGTEGQAAAAAFLASELAGYITGISLLVDGGAVRAL
jgi:enoyl-[acyl-carrier-protein] reductase (NADH)